MPTYRFNLGELTAEHRRTWVHDVELEVQIPRDAKMAPGPELLQGSIQVQGRFGIDCPASENRLRRGQLVSLKLVSPDGLFTRPEILLTELADITPLAGQQRRYHWEFLIPQRPGHDPQGLFRREGEPPPPRPEEQPRQWRGRWNRPALPLRPIQEIDPQATEVSVEDLVHHLGALGTTLDTPAVLFTAEGGFIPTSELRPRLTQP